MQQFNFCKNNFRRELDVHKELEVHKAFQVHIERELDRCSHRVGVHKEDKY